MEEIEALKEDEYREHDIELDDDTDQISNRTGYDFSATCNRVSVRSQDGQSDILKVWSDRIWNITIKYFLWLAKFKYLFMKQMGIEFIIHQIIGRS